MHLLHITSCVVLFGGTLVTSNCPVGTFDTWSAWDRCSASCGGGITKRQQSLCCPPDAHGQWSDCRAAYNITEKFKFDQKPCNQICAHGTFVAGGCRCDPGYNDICCITRETIASTQTTLGVQATTSSTNNVTETSKTSANTATSAPSTDDTTEITAFRMSANIVTTAPDTSYTTVTTQSSTSSTVTASPITSPITITMEARTSTTPVTTPNTSTATVTTPNTSTSTVAAPNTSTTTVTTPNTSTTTVTTPTTSTYTVTTPNTSTAIMQTPHSMTITTAAAESSIETTRLRITTVNTNNIHTLTTPDYSSHQAQNSSLADRKFGDDCTRTSCSSLMVCKSRPQGGHQCECKKLGSTDMCVYELIIILGSVMVGTAALITTIIIVRKKSKISPDKADVTEVGETVAVKN